MAKTEVYTCDRCKVVLTQNMRFAVTVFQSRYPRIEGDLCSKCYCALKDWLEGSDLAAKPVTVEKLVGEAFIDELEKDKVKNPENYWSELERLRAAQDADRVNPSTPESFGGSD